MKIIEKVSKMLFLFTPDIALLGSAILFFTNHKEGGFALVATGIAMFLRQLLFWEKEGKK